MANPSALANRLSTAARKLRLSADIRREAQRRAGARQRAREQRGKPAIPTGLSPTFEAQLAEQTAHVVEVVKRREAVLAVKAHGSLIAARHRSLNPQFGGDGAWVERIDGAAPAPVRPTPARAENPGGSQVTPGEETRSAPPSRASNPGRKKTHT